MEEERAVAVADTAKGRTTTTAEELDDAADVAITVGEGREDYCGR